jgi:hypothetical protein
MEEMGGMVKLNVLLEEVCYEMDLFVSVDILYLSFKALDVSFLYPCQADSREEKV